jgi:hypothetical protein
VLVRADGTREVVLDVPKYDFNGQLNYPFQQPIRIEKGSRLVVTFTYDNGTKNQIRAVLRRPFAYEVDP